MSTAADVDHEIAALVEHHGHVGMVPSEQLSQLGDETQVGDLDRLAERGVAEGPSGPVVTVAVAGEDDHLSAEANPRAPVGRLGGDPPPGGGGIAASYPCLHGVASPRCSSDTNADSRPHVSPSPPRSATVRPSRWKRSSTDGSART